jgi:tetratricopeptide (TPR) repeat protein
MTQEAVEHQLLTCLSIFPAAFTLEAAEDVCTNEQLRREDLRHLLARLAEHGVLDTTSQTTPTRYLVPEPRRTAGYQQLQASAGATALERRYINYYRSHILHLTRRRYHAGDTAVPLDHLEDELDHIRSVLQRLIELDDAEQGLQLAGGSPAGVLLDFWIETGRLAEGRDWLARLLALPSAAQPTTVRAYGLHDAGVLAWIEQDVDAALQHFEESLAIMRQLGSMAGMSEMLDHVGGVLRQQGKLQEARVRYEESLAVYRTWGKPRAMVETLERYAALLKDVGEVGAARAAFEECLTIYQDWGNDERVAAMEQKIQQLEAGASSEEPPK